MTDPMTPDPVLREAVEKALNDPRMLGMRYAQADAVLAAMDGRVVPVEEHEQLAELQAVLDAQEATDPHLAELGRRVEESWTTLAGRAVGDRFGEWLQTMLAKGDGGRVIELAQAIDDWMQVCHQQESEIERHEAALDASLSREREAVRLLRAWVDPACDAMTTQKSTLRFLASYPQEADRD